MSDPVTLVASAVIGHVASKAATKLFGNSTLGSIIGIAAGVWAGGVINPSSSTSGAAGGGADAVAASDVGALGGGGGAAELGSIVSEGVGTGLAGEVASGIGTAGGGLSTSVGLDAAARNALPAAGQQVAQNAPKNTFFSNITDYIKGVSPDEGMKFAGGIFKGMSDQANIDEVMDFRRENEAYDRQVYADKGAYGRTNDGRVVFNPEETANRLREINQSVNKPTYLNSLDTMSNLKPEGAT